MALVSIELSHRPADRF